MPRKASPAPAVQEPLNTYGFKTDPNLVRERLGKNAQLFYWQKAFAEHAYAVTFGAPPRDVLFRRIADVLMPGYFEWHPWTDRLIYALCHNQWVGIAGCSGSAKTHNLTGFACLWWLCNPAESSVIFTSTTSKALRKRNWANVQKIHSIIPGMAIGNFVDSRLIWQYKKGDDLHAIAGVAVEEGDVKASADKIKGTHTKRQMVIINEANSVNAGIFEACANLYAYPEQAGGEFILAMEANPSSWLDQFGRFTEPDKGVKSVSVDVEEWETVAKHEYNGKKGVCIRFDVEKTPNLDYPEDKPISRHIPSRQRVIRCANSAGKDSATYWSNERGFPPPEGLNKNVFSEVSLDRCDAYGQHRFAGRGVKIIGGFDTARTGDKPTLRFAAMGELENGDMAIEVMKPIAIKVNVGSNNPIVYQLLEQVRRECENVMWRGQKTSCPPENLGIDATGGGADQCDVFQRMWSFGIIRVGFGEAASEDACNHEDIRPANTVYRNKRAQMYFRTRDGFESGQIKGLDKETAREMATILFDDSKALIVIENKEDYKLRHKKSPDDTDSLVIISEVAQRRGFRLAARGQTVKKFEEHEKVVEKASKVFEQIEYAADNEDLTMSFEYAGAEEE